MEERAGQCVSSATCSAFHTEAKTNQIVETNQIVFFFLNELNFVNLLSLSFSFL